eukprot:PhF_6_TR17619/c0_g1_i1/m.26766
MFRRCFRRLCEADFKAAPDSLELSQAYGIFGYSMNQPITTVELKKRYRELILKYHPDHGGSADDFRKLQKAYKALQSHDRDTKRTFKVERMTADEGMGYNIKEAAREAVADHWDIIFLFVALAAVVGWYARRQMHLYDALVASRYKTTQEEVDESFPKEFKDRKHTWHAWRSDGSAHYRSNVATLPNVVSAE